ncbi:serine protease [Sediminicoccus sp. KRV36]|uniref:S1 family peptidase n=1 Tax=Sediminicoccus sp. KRV36 TaxID=3133721 RepID=UPI00200EB418|nr:serine protease [Sediminicoccus rosea]UPY35867.1 serine protease [Sediminicoccus rosea]
MPRLAILAPALALGFTLLMGCAPLPAQQAEGTPAARVARDSLASLQASGVSVGAAIAVDDRHVLTNAHVMRQAGGPVTIRRADGLAEVPAILVGTSPHMDLAVLRMPEGFLRPAALAPGLPVAGEPVWAMGPEGLGRALAEGRVARPYVQMRGFGPGFTAGLGALMGFSGGPVVDRSGRVMGLTTALPNPGGAPLLAAMTGVDLAGLAEGARRQVFILDIREAMAEVERMGIALAALPDQPGPIRDTRGRPWREAARQAAATSWAAIR